MSKQQALAKMIAAAVAEALAAQAQTAAPTPEKPKSKRKGKRSEARGCSWTSDTRATRGEFKFEFTLVQAGIRGGAYDKYSVVITNGSGASVEARPRIAAGMTPRERYATAGSLDALVAFRAAKKFAALA